MDSVEVSTICLYYNIYMHIRLRPEFVWRALGKRRLNSHTFELLKTEILHDLQYSRNIGFYNKAVR